MRLDLRRFKIEKAASKDVFRPTIAQPYLDAEAGRLVATDSFILAVVPVEVEEGDVSGPVPAKAITEARKHRAYKQLDNTITLNGRAEVADGAVSFKRPELTKPFPDWRKIMAMNEGEPVATFAINAAFLARCAEAIGAAADGAVRVEFFGPLKPLRITPLDAGSGAVGMVMPVRDSR